ncbi:ATP-binding cassette domain-containing protein [Bacillus thuringiensis]|uniref:ATP-binding cassette domain-containing protein n=1 Tax=Bacillus cereus group TaxID=86661 RepID=UPI0033093C8D|nr:ATP-binding cassette domain-containing protein [Bacillus cereus]MCU5270880.1 ATP-binding cassette domain-containing protein [Bacillus cereus]MCU5348433.1 ATP-binding cassette domain-containing protein [Bacillus cereus]MCU5606892.1 ATP-binding cassette domain-containing protein [Bacillus cereus]MCU5759047.1 ATP-binding cassette domain-containing protein [Bacillus cereus]
MTENYIKIENLTKEIKKQKVLDNINLSLEKGKIYGFKGRNGSGKTMLFRVISGLMRSTTGKITIDNKVLQKDISFPESVGILIEYPGFIPEYTGFNNLKLLAMIQQKIKDETIKSAISQVGLDPNDKRKFKKYSLGMKQRLGIAQAIMEDPDLLILDEPTNALDQEAINMMCELLLTLKSKGKTILIASHDNETLQKVSDTIFNIESGKIINHTVSRENKENE